MAQPRRTATTGTFFVTAVTLSRRRRFQVDATARLFIDTLQHYRRAGSYKLWAFVVMPDHIHLLITTIDLSKFMKDLKGGFTRHMEGRFWQPGFTDHRIRDRADFDAHRTYIHQNPVRARLAHAAESYAYSSAFHAPGVTHSSEPASNPTASI